MSGWDLFAPRMFFEERRRLSYTLTGSTRSGDGSEALHRRENHVVPECTGPDAGLLGAAMLPYLEAGVAADEQTRKVPHALLERPQQPTTVTGDAVLWTEQNASYFRAPPALFGADMVCASGRSPSLRSRTPFLRLNSISSRVIPFVSGTNKATNTTASKQKPANT